MRAFEACPYQQKLIRIDKLGPEKVDERRFIRGTAGHKFFELWVKRGFDETDPQIAGNILDDLVAKKHVVWFNHHDYAKLRTRVVNEASMLMESVRWHGIDRLRNPQVEGWFSAALPFGGHETRGLIDVVAEDGMWIIETKMSNNAKWIDPDQLIFYGLLLGMARERYPARMSFFLPVMDKIQDRLLDIEFSQGDFTRMLDRIKDFVAQWTNGDFPATGEGETCRWCEVKAHCINNN
jgi:hypothetical protein